MAVKKSVSSKNTLPMLPLRDIVVFPHMVVPLFVGRAKSIAAIEEAMLRDKEIFLAAQLNPKTAEPAPEHIFSVGTRSTILQLLRLPDGTVKILVEGKSRARIQSYTDNEDYFEVIAEPLEDGDSDDISIQGQVRALLAVFEEFAKLSKKVPAEMLNGVLAIEEPHQLSDTIVTHLDLKLPDKQAILEASDLEERVDLLLRHIQSEIEVLKVEKKIRGRVKKQMERTQKEYYLNEQMRAIQKELGQRDEFKSEIVELEEKLQKKVLSEEAKDRANKELKKLKMMSPMSAEATVVRNYLDWYVELPWQDYKTTEINVDEAERILDEDHFGLEKPKERVLEYLSVLKLVGQIRGPILCLAGPPGVGKTSLARSIARAVGRDFVRLSLGGVRDEAEIRGHRRTYIGALPGKIIQQLKKAGSGNPVFLLDEVDKMSMDFRGDPASALLEVLDPEQNAAFNDHYLDVDYDLSKILFIATANNRNAIPEPLLDRMEVIELDGYTEPDKVQIAKSFLIPKQIKEHGLDVDDIDFQDSSIHSLIRDYTREAGVRNLERQIAAISRKVARNKVQNEDDKKIRVTPKSLYKYLGVKKHSFTSKSEEDRVGLANGLAWTRYGGDLLNIEVSVLPGKGQLTITGKLGDVMQESARTAVSYIRSRARDLNLNTQFYQNVDIHIHVPEGATPKDGPSAGITLAVALASALTGIPVRRDVAMTGEITLRGRVLPIGGLKQKLLAAKRGGIEHVLIPLRNEKNLKEIPAKIYSGMTIQLVSHIDEVLAATLAVDDPEAFLEKLEKGEELHVLLAPKDDEESHSEAPTVTTPEHTPPHVN